MEHPRPIIEWGWAGAGLEAQSGDLHAVVPFPGGVLIALLDGLGHGPEAAAASSAALPALHNHAADPLPLLVQRCHHALRGTRGVVMSLVAFRTHDSSMTWMGIGNVDGVLFRRKTTPECADEAIEARGGVVGHQLPPLSAKTLRVSPGDTVIMATDGIQSGFRVSWTVEHPAPEIAECILARFAKGTDDAHVVVARYVGGGP